MKIPFYGLFHSRDKPGNAVSTAPTVLFGPSGAGKPVSVQSAIQVSAVYACVRVIAETIARLLLQEYKRTKMLSAMVIEQSCRYNARWGIDCLLFIRHTYCVRCDSVSV